MEKEQTYNGWANYATWRVKLEILGDAENFVEYKDKEILIEVLRETVEEAITGWGEIKDPSFALDYARVFLEDVDYEQIADFFLEENKINPPIDQTV